MQDKADIGAGEFGPAPEKGFRSLQTHIIDPVSGKMTQVLALLTEEEWQHVLSGNAVRLPRVALPQSSPFEADERKLAHHEEALSMSLSRFEELQARAAAAEQKSESMTRVLEREQAYSLQVRHLHVAIMDVAEALKDLGNLMNKGQPGGPENILQRGNIAVALRKAAHRIVHGDLVGWHSSLDNPAPEPGKPATMG